MMSESKNFLALDVGERRIGIAIASHESRLPMPMKTLENTENFFNELKKIIEDESVETLVIGLPRGLDGNETAQTKYVREFSNRLKQHIDIRIYFEDEALSSVRAEENLKLGSKPYSKDQIDALAASYILDAFLQNNAGVISG